MTGLVAVASITTLMHCSEKNPATNKAKATTCSGAQALQTTALRGSSMAPKVLALTFDDGPGARTKQLSLYLKNEGIQATFFVNGKSMGPNAGEILQAVVNDGHLVANHTENHLSLTGVSTETTRLPDPQMVQEVTDTDAKIDPFIPSKRFLFRPPFGDYDEPAANALAASPMSKYVGPVLWDVGDRMDEANGRAADWECWQEGADNKRIPMKTCGDLYLTEIRRSTRGIVLLHDPYFNEADPEQLGTVDLVMYIVPILKSEGFTFQRVDQVPEIAALLPAPTDGVNPVGGDSTVSAPAAAAPAVSADDPCK